MTTYESKFSSESTSPNVKQMVARDDLMGFVYPIVKQLHAPREQWDDLLQDGLELTLANTSPAVTMGWVRTKVYRTLLTRMNYWNGIPKSPFFDNKKCTTDKDTNNAIARWRGMISLSVEDEVRVNRTRQVHHDREIPPEPVVLTQQPIDPDSF